VDEKTMLSYFEMSLILLLLCLNIKFFHDIYSYIEIMNENIKRIYYRTIFINTSIENDVSSNEENDVSSNEENEVSNEENEVSNEENEVSNDENEVSNEESVDVSNDEISEETNELFVEVSNRIFESESCTKTEELDNDNNYLLEYIVNSDEETLNNIITLLRKKKNLLIYCYTRNEFESVVENKINGHRWNSIVSRSKWLNSLKEKSDIMINEWYIDEISN
jgi:hypothetical protein